MDIFWSFPSGIKQMIFENLTKGEQSKICYKSKGVHDICRPSIAIEFIGNFAKANNLEKVRAAINYGADVNNTKMDMSHRSPLFWAVTADNYEMVKLLLENGADVNKEDDYGQTPLFKAKSLQIAQLLLDYGALINHLDKKGNTPLYSIQNIDVIELLLNSGMDINSTNSEGDTALDAAYKSTSFNIPLIELLLNHGALSAEDL